MLKTASHVDSAMRIETEIKEKDIVFYDIRKPPFEIYGLYNPKAEKTFKRMPDDIALKVNEGVSVLYRNTSGGRVRFCTNSKYIAIHADMSGIGKMSHFALTGSAGFDMYIDEENGDSHFCGIFKPPFNVEAGFESKIDFSSEEIILKVNSTDIPKVEFSMRNKMW